MRSDMSNVLWQALHTTPAIFPELTRRATAPGEGDAGGHATLERVEREAQALMEAARRKASALMEAGHREGLVQGRAEAIAEAQNGLRDLTQSMSRAAERLQALGAECRVQADEMVVSLALTVAERILQAEIAQDPNAILKIVRGALALLPAPGEVAIRIHPEAVALLHAHRDALQGVTPEVEHLRIVSDPTVPVGGCVVETPHSMVDATFPAQLEEARRRLREEPW
jgi:flagellar assembly protein FliH